LRPVCKAQIQNKVENNYIREPNKAFGVKEHEDARTSHPCERRASHCKATCGGWRGKC